ncbi:hypothetical protein EJ05DRAFT_393914 [Pseudovirgaria hyperparasitica]|uniref:Uncharacterized protein n=1 Tax=Pseudovirgaria hyperparasitica TaxID=470096 RepID=A0A6A6W697_9PEZI|nr:uncharacterized protein EJ05DRAFT_393914 [Pseudovirgaria hyperparasitica]KAF2757554.1 hypothetical protein EJ05DRAFT_393914 [Pseudovirgaria hyperparasitica]
MMEMPRVTLLHRYATSARNVAYLFNSHWPKQWVMLPAWLCCVLWYWIYRVPYYRRNSSVEHGIDTFFLPNLIVRLYYCRSKA